MRVVGDSPKAADYAGIRTRRRILTVMAISGAIAGLGGASQIGDFGHVLDPRGLQQAGYGYTGIVVAALALYDPLAVVLVAFLLGALTNAGFSLQGPTSRRGWSASWKASSFSACWAASCSSGTGSDLRVPPPRPPAMPPPGHRASHAREVTP